MRTTQSIVKCMLLFALFAIAGSGNAQVCIEIDDPAGLDPTFEFEITGRAGDFITLSGLQRDGVGLIEQPAYGGAIFRPADDSARLSWSKQGDLQFESFRCDLDLVTSTGAGKRTSIEDGATTIVDVSCEIVAC